MASDSCVIASLDNLNIDECRDIIIKSLSDDSISDNVIFKAHDLVTMIGLSGLRDFVQSLADEGINPDSVQWMFDPKWHDISHTNMNYFDRIRQSGLKNVRYVTVHASAGPETFQKLRAFCDEHLPDTKILAITVLTSLSDEECYRIYGRSMRHQVLQLAKIALDNGAHGIVCSYAECPLLREVYGSQFDLVIPGIRPTAHQVEGDDQDPDRKATPADAIKNGATNVVVGRPITRSDDPSSVIREIVDEIRSSEFEPGEPQFQFEKNLMTGSWEDILKAAGAFYKKPERSNLYVRLTSGAVSNAYFNFGVVERQTELLDRMGEDLLSKLVEKEITCDIVVGAQMGSVRISSYVAKALGVPSIYTEKGSSGGKMTETSMTLKRHDIDLNGKRVLIAEDVINRGATSIKMIEFLRERGAEVVGETCIVNRSEQSELAGVEIIECFIPEKFKIYHDENSPEEVKEKFPPLPEEGEVVEKVKNDWDRLQEEMRRLG